MTPRLVIGIVDPCCPSGYGAGTLATGLGGTEATVLNVVGALTGSFRFQLFQNRRTEASQAAGVAAFPLAEADRADCAAMVVINSWKAACRLRTRHPDVPITLWLHIFPGRHNRAMGAALRDHGIDVVCVSQSHADALVAFLGDGPKPRIGHIWNCIADDLTPDATPRDPDLLLYASSPHKGLAEVLARFAALRDRMPGLRLEVADPGYLRWEVGEIPAGVTMLGRLDHPALIDRMRCALCLFYPQTTFRETFGLVLAEANAVGTPVLAQAGLGANDEVLRGAGQCRDVSDPDLVEQQVRAWQARAPAVSVLAGFRLAAVADRWAGHLGGLLDRDTDARMSAHAR